MPAATTNRQPRRPRARSPAFPLPSGSEHVGRRAGLRPRQEAEATPPARADDRFRRRAITRLRWESNREEAVCSTMQRSGGAVERRPDVVARRVVAAATGASRKGNLLRDGRTESEIVRTPLPSPRWSRGRSRRRACFACRPGGWYGDEGSDGLYLPGLCRSSRCTCEAHRRRPSLGLPGGCAGRTGGCPPIRLRPERL